jgi:oxygen-independent coproporphyrinogen-3 oxidase
MPPNSSPLLGFGVSNSASLLAALPPLSLYIHIPWCVKKCPYCDFNSHEVRPIAAAIPIAAAARTPVRFEREGGPRVKPLDLDGSAQSNASLVQSDRKNGLDAAVEQHYIAALLADLDATLPKVWGRRIHTIFFGGGTPSLFSAGGIDTILNAVRARLVVDADAEITLEANPGTFESNKFKGYRDAGVNRLSIGIQSFNAAHLKALGRIHDSDEAKRAIDTAQTHFDNINLDLMYALPSQTLHECEADIQTALGFGTHHLSLYHLTLEPNTLFHAKPPPLPDDDAAADMQDMIAAALARAGYEHYETSAYAKRGKRSRHNMNYWQFGDYLGIGAGAHAKISFPDRITREARYKQPKAFMDAALAGNAAQDCRMIAAPELPFEFMLNALRLNEGFPLALFTERTGLPIHVISREMDVAEANGLIRRDHQHMQPTEKGRLFLNELLQVFLPG